jgi:hypothetical protein
MSTSQMKNLVTASMALAGAKAACRALASTENTPAEGSRQLLLSFVEQCHDLVREAIKRDSAEAFADFVDFVRDSMTRTMHVPTSILASELLPVLTEGE